MHAIDTFSFSSLNLNVTDCKTVLSARSLQVRSVQVFGVIVCDYQQPCLQHNVVFPH